MRGPSNRWPDCPEIGSKSVHEPSLHDIEILNSLVKVAFPQSQRETLHKGDAV